MKTQNTDVGMVLSKKEKRKLLQDQEKSGNLF